MEPIIDNENEEIQRKRSSCLVSNSNINNIHQNRHKQDIVGLSDLCFLEKVEEIDLMNNLSNRFHKDIIYTYIGEQIVSVNPFSKKSNIYTDQVLKSYQNMYMYEVSPHIYALAQDTYKKLLLSKENQCVIITGESGAGKTEASKIFLDYISKVCNTTNSTSKESIEGIMKLILESNVVLESFGNAKTLRNDNSSRFGKFIEIEFDGKGTPISGKISQFLLEKSRVHSRAIGERSFHIFYQFLTDSKLTSKFNLSNDVSYYKYLKDSMCFSVSSINDAKEFQQLQSSLKQLSWSEIEMESIWRVLGAILLIGNIEFANDVEKSNVDAVYVSNPEILKKVANLLQCNQDNLEKSLISRSLTLGAGKRQSSIRVLLNASQARETRDAFSKVLYDRLFSSIIDKINLSISSSNNSSSGTTTKQYVESIIGILDIYGFEVFENNSFEQFIINYSNEKLQQLFINLVLRQEQEEYLKEGIEWKTIDNYFDNTPIIDLIEGQPVGLLKLLEEACLIGQSTPELLIQKFNQFFSKNKHFESFETSNNLSIESLSFTLKHYAAPVTYNLDNFIYKNKDPLYQDLIFTMETSKDKFIYSLFFKDFQKNNPGVKKIPITAATQFKNAINELIGKLNSCQPHYIRCIKSNDEKKPMYFDYERVKHQIRYLNMLETIRVRKAGYCHKQHYTRFLSRYKMLSKETWPFWNGSPKDGVFAIVRAMAIQNSNSECQFGKKKLFIKSASTLFHFEEQRSKVLPSIVITIQRVYRGYKARQWYKKEQQRLREEKEEIQKQIKRKKSANLIQSCYLCYKVRTYVNKLKPWSTAPHYNKGHIMPTLWIRRTPIDSLIQSIHITWWAKVKVTSLSMEGRALVRQKILALDLFGMGYSRKKEWDCRRKFQADYLSDDSNPKKSQFSEAVQLLFQKGGDKEILFADNVIKINKRGKSQLRSLIITDQHIYKYDPKKYTQKKVGLKIHSIVALSTSNKRDTFLAIHFKQPIRDLYIDLGCDFVEKVSEVSTNLVQQVFKLTGTAIPLVFRDPLTFNNSRDSRNNGTDFVISFAQYPKGKEQRQSTFIKGKGNTAIVYYNLE